MLTANLKSTIKLFKAHSDNECVKAVSGILEYVKNEKAIPRPYETLLKEVKKDSPISSWLPSYSQADTKLFLSFLTGQCDIFSDLEKTTKFTHAFPFVARIISEFLSFHCERFLPPHLTDFMFALIRLRDQFDQLAENCAVKRTKPKSDHISAPVEVFPNNPEHTVENTYAADDNEDKTQDEPCRKNYNSSFDISRGITHISCEHNIVKGFTALYRGESALKVNSLFLLFLSPFLCLVYMPSYIPDIFIS